MVTEYENSIKLDIDIRHTKKNYDKMIKRIELGLLLLGIKKYKIEKFETKHGYHIKIRLFKKIPPMEIITIQAILGSDWKRECFNYIRVKNNAKNWNVLFKKKVNYNGIIISEERELK